MKAGKRYGVLLSAALGFAFFHTAWAQEPVVTVNDQVVSGNTVEVVKSATVTLATSFPEGEIFYTTDGAAPTFNNARYTGPFTVTTDTTLRAIAYSSTLTESAEREPLFIRVLDYFTLQVTTMPGSIVTIEPQQEEYLEGTTVTVTASVPENAEFWRWTGTVSGMEPSISVVMDRQHRLTARFKPFVEAEVIGNGEVIVTPQYPLPSILPDYGAVVLSAVPEPGFHFVRWEFPEGEEGEAEYLKRSPETVSPLLLGIPEEWSTTGKIAPVVAIFAPLAENQSSLTIVVEGGMGMVDVMPARNVFEAGETVQLTARAGMVMGARWMAFAGWSGAVESQESTIEIVMDESKAVTARFFGWDGREMGENLFPRDEEGNVYRNRIGSMVVSGPTRNWSFEAYTPPAASGEWVPVSIAEETIYVSNFVDNYPQLHPLTYGLYALNVDGSLRWVRTNLNARVVLDSQDRPYVASTVMETGKFLALDPETGSTVWEGVGTMPIIGWEDRIYTVLEDMVYIYEPSGDLYSSFPLAGAAAGPMILHPSGDMIVPLESGVARYTSSGDLVWANDTPLFSLALAGDDLVIGASQERGTYEETEGLMGVDASTGELAWVHESSLLYFRWSLDRFGVLTLMQISEVPEPPVMAETDVPLSPQSPWPWTGGDYLNRSKVQVIVSPELSLAVSGGEIVLSVPETVAGATIYESVDLVNWEELGDLPGGQEITIEPEGERRFFKAVWE